MRHGVCNFVKQPEPEPVIISDMATQEQQVRESSDNQLLDMLRWEDDGGQNVDSQYQWLPLTSEPKAGWRPHGKRPQRAANSKIASSSAAAAE